MNVKRLVIIAGVLCVAAFAIFQWANNALVPEETPRQQQLADVFSGETRAILENADTFTLFSLDPMGGHKRPKGFHGYEILGKTSVITTRQQLVEALYKGVTTKDVFGASCFYPRHGIRAEKDGKILDLIICFECQIIVVIPPGKTRNTVHWPNISEPGTIISSSAKPAFDQILKNAKIPLISTSNEFD